jgi:cell division topological specificity factor
MSLIALFKPRGSAPVARERLQILLAHERAIVGQTDLVTVLREEILAAISRHVAIDPEKIMVSMERGEQVSLLEVDVELPIPVCLKAAS